MATGIMRDTGMQVVVGSARSSNRLHSVQKPATASALHQTCTSLHMVREALVILNHEGRHLAVTRGVAFFLALHDGLLDPTRQRQVDLQAHASISCRREKSSVLFGHGELTEACSANFRPATADPKEVQQREVNSAACSSERKSQIAPMAVLVL